MYDINTIVVGVDGSPNGEHALDVATEIARKNEAAIVLVHVEEIVLGKAGPAPIRVDKEDLLAAARARAKTLSDDGVTASVETAESTIGGPAHVIADIAERHDADLVVVGTRGLSPIRGLILGSVTQRLLHLAHRPVLAVPPQQDS